MKQVINHIKSDKILLLSVRLAILFLVGEIIFLAIKYTSLPPILPLYNQLPWGDERLVSKPMIFFPTILTLVFFLCNMFFANYVYPKMPLVARLLGITTLLLVSLSLIATIQTVLLLL